MCIRDRSYIKTNWSNKKKYEECTFRWYWYYKHIMNNELVFPEKVLIHRDVQGLLKAMLEKDPIKRISYSQMKNHPFMNYYLLMHKTKQKGVTYRITSVSFKQSKIMKEKDARKNFKIVLKNKVKEELEKNKLRRKTLYEKHRKAKEERKKKKKEQEKKPKIDKGPKKSTLFGVDPIDYRQKNKINDYDINNNPKSKINLKLINRTTI